MITVFGSGRLTRDPEHNGKVCKFSVACDYYFGEKKTTFLQCVSFGKRAENFAEWLHKGDPVTFQGTLEIREYEGKYYTSCLINDLVLPPKRNPESYQPPVASTPDNIDDGDVPF